MFGYITVNRDELKVRELNDYQAAYCGLCHALHKRHGRAGQMTLTYDMTFLVILLNGLYEEKMQEKDSRCVVHPAKKHRMRWNELSSYAADMNVLLAYYNLLDDWQDEKKPSRFLAAKTLAKACRQIESDYPRQGNAVRAYMDALSECEQSQNEDIELAACLTGRMLAEIFVFKEDEWSADLRQMGFFLGKYIYLMDAYEDVEKDRKSGNYNPLIPLSRRSDFDSECQQILMMQIAECCRAFERLPIIEDVGILRNILYSGIWAKFAAVYKRRKDNKTGENL
jgi:hypothetical protein